eukprot:g13155.t1
MPATVEIRDGSVSRQQRATDRDILLILFRDTGGSSWHNNAGWGSDRPLDEWHGVTATSAGRVAGLALRYNNLRGVLPPELGELHALEHLHLTNNELYGSIPQELGQLQALQELRLYCNHLSGSIPPQLGRLRALKKLVLYSNKLSGAIPSELAELRSLEELLLSDNSQLEGDIPPELEQTIARNRRKWAPLQTRSTGTLSGFFSPIAGSPMGDTGGHSRDTPHRQHERAVVADDADGSVTDSAVGDDGGRGGGDGVVVAGGGSSGGGADGDYGGDDGGVAIGRRIPGQNKNKEPWVARFLDYIADVWHVVVPITDDLTSAWLLASTAPAAATTTAADASQPIWWACLLALSMAGLERAWLLVTVAATAAVIPMLFFARAALNLVSWFGRLCCTFPIGTVCCLFLLCCCRPCIKFAEEHPRGWRVTAARLFRRLNCAGTAVPRISPGDYYNAPVPTMGGGPSHAVMFLDALLWALVGSRARCSRFWEGLGWSLNARGTSPGGSGGGGGGGRLVAFTFGDVVDTWVGYHPFSWLGKAVFGRLGCPRRFYCWSSGEGKGCCTLGRGRSSSSSSRNDARNHGGDDASSSEASDNSDDNSGSRSGEGGQGDISSSSRRRRGQVLVRAVGETLVVDGLSLALSAVARGGWNGSLTGIAGVSALFSALQLLTELRYYVTEATEALEPGVSFDGDDAADVVGGSSSSDISEPWESSSSSRSSGESDVSDATDDSTILFNWCHGLSIGRKRRMPLKYSCQGCPKRAYFGKYSGKVECCRDHAEDGMVDMKNKKCAQHDCTKHPSYGKSVGKPEFCRDHSEDGMVAKTFKIGTKMVIDVRVLGNDEQELYHSAGQGRGKEVLEPRELRGESPRGK